jgi:glycerophosphoryl diester phosphodiesterase
LVLVTGHRGCGTKGIGLGEPENTLHSIRKAVELGADQVEVDAHLSQDNRVVVIHDSTVDRTTNERGKVRDYTLAELEALDAGQGERVPTLEEVIDSVKAKAMLQIELKGIGVEDEVTRIIKASGMVKQSVLTSFRHDAVARAKTLEPNICTGVLFVCQPINTARLAEDAGADNIHPNVEYVDASLVESAHRKGLGVYVWNADTEEKAIEMLRLEVDAIGTNRLDIVLPRAQQLHRHTRVGNGRRKRAAQPRIA